MSTLKHHVVAAMDAQAADIIAKHAPALEAASRKPTTLGYSNPKVDALIAGHISLAPGTFTQRDFIDLAIAALDQGGVSVRTQRRVNELVQDDREGQDYVTHDEQMEAGHA